MATNQWNTALYDTRHGFVTKYGEDLVGLLAPQSGERILDVVPEKLHQRVPVILGSRNEVARIGRYHDEYDRGADKPFTSPLFNERSLFLPETPM